MKQREGESDDDFEDRIHHIEEMVRDYPEEEEEEFDDDDYDSDED